MDMNYDEIFGLGDGENGEEAQSAADSAASDEDVTLGDGAGEESGGEEREVADPADDGEGEDSHEGEEDAGDGESSDEDARDRGEDARYAAARRRAERERDLAIESVRSQSKKDFEMLMNALGIRGEDGRRITTREELEAFTRGKAEKERASALKRAGVSGEVIEELIETHPAVRAARELTDRLAAEEERSSEVQRMERFREELREITKLDPTVKDAADLRSKEYYGELYDRVKKGYSLVDAYRLATYDRSVAAAAKNARRQAVTSAASREHLKPTASPRGDVLGAVPPEVLEQYRLLNPAATDAEIARDWKKYSSARKPK